MATDGLIKFPRTPHLRDFGSATRDDLVFSKDDALAVLARGVIIEEKVDGANLGISFATLDGPPRCQKRGHWVTCQSEQQFSKLEGWLAQHAEDLREALGTRFVLYGEWVAARHSVPYDALPDWFLAYDIYDKQATKFLSSRRRDELLRRTRVRTVPTIAAAPGRVFRGPDALDSVRQLVLELRSALCVPGSEQWAEGVYLRQEHDGWLVVRAKLVHPAFLQAIEGGGGPAGGMHWSKREVQWNRLRPDLWMEPFLDLDPDGPELSADPDPVQGEEVAPRAAAAPDEAPLDRMSQPTPASTPAPYPRDATSAGPSDPRVRVAPTRSAAEQADKAAAVAAAVASPASSSQPLVERVGAEGVASKPPTASRKASMAAAAGGTAIQASAAQLELVDGGYYISLVGEAIDAVANCLTSQTGCVPLGHVGNRVARDGPHYHITLITPPEMVELRDQHGLSAEEIFDRILSVAGPSGGAWAPLGLGRVCRSESGDEALFVVVGWPMGRSARAALGLAREQHFHITLGFNTQDVHGVPKGISAMVGGVLDHDQLARLCNVAASAGAPSSREDLAAVLVLQVLTELNRSKGPAVDAGSSSTAASVASPTLAPNVVDSLYGMLRAALDWAGPSVDTSVVPDRKAPLPSSISASRASAKAAASKVHDDARRTEEYGRSVFVAACAHVAFARLAGLYSEYDEVDEHVRHAEAALAEDVHGASSSSPAGCSEFDMVLAAAACLTGKAHFQRGSFGAAAASFSHAASLLEHATAAAAAAAGAGTATAATVGSDDLASLLRAAVTPSLDATALRAAAATCARRAAPSVHPTSSSSAFSCSSFSSSSSQSHSKVASEQHQAPEERARGQGEADAADGRQEQHQLQQHQQHQRQQQGSELQAGQLQNTRARTVVPGVQVSAATAGAVAAVADVTLPRNTSWVVPGVLAGGSTPKHREQIAALRTQGVDLIITLTQEEPLPGDWFTVVPAAAAAAAGANGGADGASNVRNLFVPVINYEPPSVQQMDDILAAIEEHVITAAVPPAAAAAAGAAATSMPRGAVLVHCGGGKGRAGTVLACYLCKHGTAPPPPPPPPSRPQQPAGVRAPAMSADAAVRQIRDLRPGSIETEQQRRFVGRYCDILWRRYDEGMSAVVDAETLAVAHGSASSDVREPEQDTERPAAVAALAAVSREALEGQEVNNAAREGPSEPRQPDTRPQRQPQEPELQQQQQQRHQDEQRQIEEQPRQKQPHRQQQNQQQQEHEQKPQQEKDQEQQTRQQQQQQQQQQEQGRQQQQQRTGRRQPAGRTSGAGPSATQPPPPPPRKLPRLAMLVGLPGSGKSTFSRALESSGRWSRICQDECGSRGAAEAAFSAAMLRGPAAGWRPHVVLDRCSPDAPDRREWFKMALLGRREKGIVAVFFDVDQAVCKARVAARADHPTIAQGRGRRIVDSFAARLEPPTTAEGFERVYVIRDPRDAEALLAAWGAGGGSQVDGAASAVAATAEDDEDEARK